MKSLLVFLVATMVGTLLLAACGESGSDKTNNGRSDDDFDDDIDNDVDDDIDDDTDDDDADDDIDDDLDDDIDDDVDDDIDDDCEDQYEPNDANPGSFLGDITGDREELYARIGSPYDIDKFYVWASDPATNWWDPIVAAWLDGIPFSCNYDMYLYKCSDSSCSVREPKDASVNPNSEPEYVAWNDQFGVEDGGYYQIEIISVQGYSCIEDYHFRVQGQ